MSDQEHPEAGEPQSLGAELRHWFLQPPRQHGDVIKDRTVSFLELFLVDAVRCPRPRSSGSGAPWRIRRYDRDMSKIPAVDPTRPLSALERGQRRILLTKPGKWFAMQVSTRIDPPLLRLTSGRFSTGVAFPIVLMTVRGRKSGEPRTVPLVYFTDGDDVILIASSFGRPTHPAWYLNVTANPEVELLGGGARKRYSAQETEGEDRDRLFALAEQLYSGYGLYAESAGEREIPVLRLTADIE